MSVVKRTAAALAALLLALPVALFAGYDLLAFQSRKPDVEALLAQASPDERALPNVLAQLTLVNLGGQTAQRTATLLMTDLDVPHVAPGVLGWHLTRALWSACVALHWSEQQQLTLLAARSPMGDGRLGYAAEAAARFQRPLTALSLNEAATLVALTHSPSAFSTSPERLARRREWLLSRLPSG